jgi:hypothetical protein
MSYLLEEHRRVDPEIDFITTSMRQTCLGRVMLALIVVGAFLYWVYKQVEDGIGFAGRLWHLMRHGLPRH